MIITAVVVTRKDMEEGEFCCCCLRLFVSILHCVLNLLLSEYLASSGWQMDSLFSLSAAGEADIDVAFAVCWRLFCCSRSRLRSHVIVCLSRYGYGSYSPYGYRYEPLNGSLVARLPGGRLPPPWRRALSLHCVSNIERLQVAFDESLTLTHFLYHSLLSLSPATMGTIRTRPTRVTVVGWAVIRGKLLK